MNYIRQLNGFWNWKSQNVLSHTQTDLYLAILHVANKSGWKGAFNIPNTTLFGLCQIGKAELHKNRLALIQKGLIAYSKGKKGTAGIYIIGMLYETNQDTNVPTNQDTNVPTIPKQNKTKTKKDIFTDIQKEKQDAVILSTDEWKAFDAMRKADKKPWTEHAAALAVKELEKLAPGDIEKQKLILNQSVFRGWAGLFQLKQSDSQQSSDSDNIFFNMLREEGKL